MKERLAIKKEGRVRLFNLFSPYNRPSVHSFPPFHNPVLHTRLSYKANFTYFSTINLEKAARNHEIQMPILWTIQQTEHISCSQCINTIFTVLCFAVKLAAHSMCFTATSLAICKACSHTTVKYCLYQWLCRIFVHHFIATRIIKSVIETEFMILQIFG